MSSRIATPKSQDRWADGHATTPDSVSIAYRDYGGAGPAVILIPGIGGNLEAEHETAIRLAERWRIVSMDPRGIGQSGDSKTVTAHELVVNVETVIEELSLRPAAVVGHSMGGVIAGLYATAHPGVPVVSVDGFAAGVASVGSADDHQDLRRFMQRARTGLNAMTAEPSEGDNRWKMEQTRMIMRLLDAMGYVAAHRTTMVARQFVQIPGDRWRRHPSRTLVDGAGRAAFGEHPTNIVHMFRTCTGPVLILRCDRSDWPPVLDAELDDLVATHAHISVQHLPLTHTGPVTDGVTMTAAAISTFLARLTAQPKES